MKSLEAKKRFKVVSEAFFYLLVFASITCFAMVQAYGEPPDELNRFKVVNFICRYGHLPHGADPEVLLDGYGASYAFQPILTYIIQGFLLRALKLFTENAYVLLLAARMVNVVFGVLMAYFVRQIAKEIWENLYLQWVFTIMTVFLPQNIFIHSYVNTDSMAMLAVSMIYTALLRARKTDYCKKDCILLSSGIILCAMSYYNAYGIILAAILIFALNFVHIGARAKTETDGEKTIEKMGLWIEWKSLLGRGIFISIIVLSGISWWFLRNALLYEGDIIAMNARRECAIQTAIEQFNPLTRFTYQNSGSSLWDMLSDTDYIILVFNSFVAMFGSMNIPTHGLSYLFYMYFWITACAIALLIPKRLWSPTGDSARTGPRKKNILFSGGMLLFCLITITLSLIYSYTWEFQPQGRYILPILIPFMHLVTFGVQKLYGVLQKSAKWLENRLTKGHSTAFWTKAGKIAGNLLCLGIMAYVLLTFAYSLFCSFLPYYSQNENLFSLWGQNI